MTNAMQQLLVICEAINGRDGWYDEDGFGYYPIFTFYSKEEMEKIKEVEQKRRRYDINYLLNAIHGSIWDASVRYISIGTRSDTTVSGFPICLNSKERPNLLVSSFLNCAVYAMV